MPVDKDNYNRYNGNKQHDEGGAAMLIYAIGWHWEHPHDFVKIRPDGIHGMQIILIRSKARICMGEYEYQVQPNTAFIVESCYPHSLFGDGETYIDDWVRFDLESDDSTFLKENGLPFNTPILLTTDTVSQLIQICEQIFQTNRPEKDTVLRYMMSAIMVQMKSEYRPAEIKPRTHYDVEFEQLRQDIYAFPQREWNIAGIAEQMNMSVSHFQRLYKQRFGIPCTKDILTSRMEYAKQLLATTDLSAVEVAERCGYSDYSHFSRVFTKYACVSPAKYRKEK